METALTEIIAAIKTGEGNLDDAWLDKLVRRHNRASHDATRRVAKKRLLPYYLRVKAEDRARWESWGVDEACEERLVRLLKAKPRRTASGVATITVLTKPHPCSSDCLYCPNDVRMPRSYLADEPACQRAERNYFDPYLQVTARLRALTDMGHVTDKVELIVLGGTWSDYAPAYQVWFIRELFRALNDAGVTAGDAELPRGALAPEAVASSASGASGEGVAAVGETLSAGASLARASVATDEAEAREALYQSCGFAHDRDELAQRVAREQQAVIRGEMTYNQAVSRLYRSGCWREAERFQEATMTSLEHEHRRNEDAAHRVVGLVIETRPDLITAESLTMMRRLGCTKVQMGIQSLDELILRANERDIAVERIAEAFRLLRQFGFKIHVHFMVNLLGATPEADKADYCTLVEDVRFRPDEVKLYPCCLVESSRLRACFADGRWAPYDEETLVGVLAADVLATPAYTRISRMIRDISSGDIMAGNKKTNLRQMVEQRVGQRAHAEGLRVREIRQREISTHDVDVDELTLDCVEYEAVGSTERFLQWVTPEGRIAGFLRLSLPHGGGGGARADARGGAQSGVRAGCGPEVSGDLGKVAHAGDGAPVSADEAMIREVHVYGRVARLHAAGEGAQHAGLGRRLVEEACAQAQELGYRAVNVISAVGTRNYYRSLGFADNGLYQQRPLP